MNKLGLNDLIASMRLGGVFCLAVLCGVLAAGSSAQTNSTWTDATGNWSNAANWNNGVPNGNFNALISNGNPGVATVNLDINATIANLELDTQNTLNVQAGKTLTFQSSSGSTGTGGGTINLASGGSLVVGSGDSLTATSLTVNMAGPNSTISGTTGTEFMNIGSVVGSGTISNMQVNVNGTVMVEGGTLTVKPNSAGFDIQNLLVVTTGSTLDITGGPFLNFDPTTGTLAGVAAGGLGDPTVGIHLQGTLKFDGANVLALSFGVPLTLDGPNAKIVDQNNNNALANLSSLGFTGKLGLQNGASLSTDVGLSANDFNDLEVRSGSTLNIGGTLEFSESTVTVDASTMKVSGDFDLFGGDGPGELTVSNGGKLTVLGGFTQTSGGATNTAVAVSHGSAMNVNGDFSNQAFVSGSGFTTSVTVDGNSVLKVGGNFTSTGSAVTTISGSSTLNIGKDLTQTVVEGCVGCPAAPVINLLTGSSANVGGSVNNAGTIGIDGTSSLTAKGGFNQSGGSTLVNGALNVTGTGANFQGGKLSGTGTLNGNLTMAGMMMPGNPTGTFMLNGNYTQTSAGTLAEQVGWLSGSNANLFKVSGTASLAGTLALSLLSGYNPMVGDSFILMTFLSDTGTFGNVTGTNLGNNLLLDVIYDAHDVRVEVESASTVTPEPGCNLLLLAGLLPVLLLARKRLPKSILPVIS
jgi:hypothetical protein